MKKSIIYIFVPIICMMLATLYACNGSDMSKQKAKEQAAKEARKKSVQEYNQRLNTASTGKLDEKTGMLDLEGVNHVLPNHYANNKQITGIKATSKVDVINDGAFTSCSNLKTISVNSYTVGVDAFKDCISLETAHLGESAWWLRAGCFENCPKLKSLLLGICMKK